MNALTIPTGDQAVILLAEALGAHRQLSDLESRVLHRAIRRDTGSFRRWTPADDTKLLKMHRAKLGAAHMATQLGRSADAIYQRLKKLKKAQKVKRHG